MQVTKEEENILLAELIQESNIPALDPKNEVTIKMMMDQTGRSEIVVRAFLEGKVSKGELQKHKVYREDGARVMAYYDPKRQKP